MQNFSEKQIESYIENSLQAITMLLEKIDLIKNAGEMISYALKSGNKIITAGNGGSAAEAMHLSEELIGRYKYDRKSLAAICLNADCTAITCIANDYDFESIYSRQIEGLGQKGDIFVAFSSSGNSKNLIKAVKAAKSADMKIISLLGKDGGQLKGMGDCDIVVPAQNTENVQEAHQVILHLLLEIVESKL